MYLFISADSQELDKSINHQLAQSELWQKLTTQNNNNNTINSNSSGVDTGNTNKVSNTETVPINNLYMYNLVRPFLKEFLFLLQTFTMCSHNIRIVRHVLLFLICI